MFEFTLPTFRAFVPRSKKLKKKMEFSDPILTPHRPSKVVVIYSDGHFFGWGFQDRVQKSEQFFEFI